MIMTRILQKAFPKFTEFLRSEMPLAAMNLRVKTGIGSAAGGARLEMIGDALQWNNSPWVEPANLVDLKIGMGLYVPGSDKIYVDYRFMLQFETDRGMVKTPNGLMLPYLYVLLLHELTHWAADRDGLEEKEEVGEKLETALYGGKIYPNTQLFKLKQQFGTFEAMIERIRKLN